MANEINIIDAIGSLYRGDYFSAGDGTDSAGNPIEIVWKDGHTTTSAEQDAIDAELIRLQTAYDAQDYARNRKVEYDQLNQFELISDDSINGTTTHKDAILAIKAKYPKE